MLIENRSAELNTECSSCGYPLDSDHTGPCPECGGTNKTYNKHLKATVIVRPSLSWKGFHEYYEKRPLLLVIVGCITLGSPVLGLVLAGWVGLVVGLALGVLCFFMGLRAMTRVREITERR